jgi:hypothetical protein
VALFSRNGGEVPADPQALGRAILGLLDTMAAHRPVVVALDDEQWLDRASARVLAFALRRVREQRISVLLARRPQSGGALWTELSLGFGAKRLIPLVIRPLELSAIQGVVGEQLPVEIPRALVGRIHVASGGNPLFALAIAREVDTRRAAGDTPTTLPIPDTLAGVIEQRLAKLDPLATDPLLVAAAVSRPALGLVQAVVPGETFLLNDDVPTQSQFLLATARYLVGAFEFYDGRDPEPDGSDLHTRRDIPDIAAPVHLTAGSAARTALSSRAAPLSPRVPRTGLWLSFGEPELHAARAESAISA